MRKMAKMVIGVFLVLTVGACATTGPGTAPMSPVAKEPAVVPAPAVSPVPITPAAPLTVPTVVEKVITYEVLGVKSRAEKVGIYLHQNGFSAVVKSTEKEMMGQHDGKPWPGVNVVRKGAAKGEGVWVPVSDAALKKGLCSDQQSFLDNLPRWEEKVVQKQVLQQSAPVPVAAVAPTGGSCQDQPFERRGFWAGVPLGGTYAEVKLKPVGYKITMTQVGDFVCSPKDCYLSHQPPDAGELSGRWGGNWALVRQWPAGDGGQHATIQLWQRQ